MKGAHQRNDDIPCRSRSTGTKKTTYSQPPVAIWWEFYRTRCIGCLLGVVPMLVQLLLQRLSSWW